MSCHGEETMRKRAHGLSAQKKGIKTQPKPMSRPRHTPHLEGIEEHALHFPTISASLYSRLLVGGTCRMHKYELPQPAQGKPVLSTNRGGYKLPSPKRNACLKIPPIHQISYDKLPLMPRQCSRSALCLKPCHPEATNPYAKPPSFVVGRKT